MAITSKAIGTNTLIGDSAVTGTIIKDVSGGAKTLYAIYVRNADAAQRVYLKLYDDLSPTLGTTDPDWIFMVDDNAAAPGGVHRFVLNAPTGVVFAKGISYAAVTTGGTAGTTNPDTALEVEFVTS